MKTNLNMVKKLRIARNWSQEQLSEACGLSLRTIQRLENGGNASLESIRVLAAVFEIDSNELILNEKEEPITPRDAVERGLRQFANFSGTATRLEYGWFSLFVMLVLAACTIIDERAAQITGLILLVPFLAAGARRLNATGHSGWWQLLWFVPFGQIAVLVVMFQDENRRSIQPLTAAVVLLLVSSGLIFPVGAQDFGMTLPEPTGSPVGFRLYAVVDEAREEVFTEEEGDVRTFPLAIYYPAVPAVDAVPAPYTTAAENAVYNTALMMPSEIFNAITGHLYIDAPLAPREGGYPVLMFSPGFGAPIRFYSTLLTELASRGFAVVVVDHPYSQTVALFPDDSVITANAAGSNLSTPQALSLILNTWIEDTIYALDHLSELNEVDPVLAGAFALDHVGALGHSFGGATAANVSLVDDRVLASINMDGEVFGDAAQGVTKPFMIMTSPTDFSDEDLAAVGMTRQEFEDSMAEFNNSINGALSASEAPYHLSIAGTLHSTYSIDIALLRNLLPEHITPELVGTIDGVRANQVIADYTEAFFNRYLRGEESSLLDGISANYPEVEFVTVSSNEQ